MADFFDTPIEYLKGVGPQRAAMLQKELRIFTFGDLIQHYPFRHEDRTTFFSIKDLTEEMPFVQVKGRITRKELVGVGSKKRLTARLQDETGEMELVWFQGINWANEKVKVGVPYVAFGKPNRYGQRFTMAHPELDVLTEKNEKGSGLYPVYPISEKLRARHIDSKTLSKLMAELMPLALPEIAGRGHQAPFLYGQAAGD
jgi:ATP-dependent DNA helicase RecG